MRRLICTLMILGFVGITPVVHAEDAMITATAREVTKEGIRAYDEGRYEEAERKLALAYSVMQLPTVALYRARALERLGKLVQSSELLLEVTRLERAPAWQPIQDQAQTEAQSERDALMPRIPRLQLQIVGADPDQTSITIDGVTVPAALLAMGAMVDPGDHVVKAKHGQQEVTQSYRVHEGQRLDGKLTFSNEQSPAAHRAVAALTNPRPTHHDEESLKPRVTAKLDGRSNENLQRWMGWGAIGLGGVGLLVGTVEGAIAMSKRNALLDSGKCPTDEHCQASASDQVDALNTARTVSSVGFVAGGILAATGAALLLWSPKSPSTSGTLLTFGPGFVKATRTF